MRRTALAFLALVVACGANQDPRPPSVEARAPIDVTGPLGALRLACSRGEDASCEALAEAEMGSPSSTAAALRDRELFRQLCDVNALAGACVALGHVLPESEASRSVQLYERACAARHHAGCTSLAQAYAQGRGVPRDVAKAMAIHRTSCDAGDGAACASWAALIEAEPTPDLARAASLYQRACDADVAEGCAGYADALFDGRGVANDDARAAALYEEACSKGFARGCAGLGRALATGRGLPKDVVRGGELLRGACSAKVARACVDLANELADEGGPMHDDGAALALYVPACDGGDARACVQAGKLVADGRGTGASPTRAAELWSRACDAGEASGCSRLGELRLSGRGVAKDLASGADLLNRACLKGENAACNVLGIAYALGNGVPRDDARAESLFRVACNAGSVTGCSHLGLCYGERRSDATSTSLGIEQAATDCKRTALACQWLGRVSAENATHAFNVLVDSCSDEVAAACSSLAGALASGHVPKDASNIVFARIRDQCDHGEVLWCRRVAYWYEEGLSVTKNPRLARKFYKKACDAGDLRACADFGRMLAVGSGGAKDVSTATSLLRATCAGGERGVFACGHLGMILVNEGKPEAHDEGAKLLDRACSGGDALACHRLGGFFAVGAKGFPRDEPRATRMFEAACALGGEACDEAKRLREEHRTVEDYERAPEAVTPPSSR